MTLLNRSFCFSLRDFRVSQRTVHRKKSLEKMRLSNTPGRKPSCAINCIFNARGIANFPLCTWLGCVSFRIGSRQCTWSQLTGTTAIIFRRELFPLSLFPYPIFLVPLDDRFPMRPLHTPQFSLLAVRSCGDYCVIYSNFRDYSVILRINNFTHCDLCLDFYNINTTLIELMTIS